MRTSCRLICSQARVEEAKMIVRYYIRILWVIAMFVATSASSSTSTKSRKIPRRSIATKISHEDPEAMLANVTRGDALLFNRTKICGNQRENIGINETRSGSNDLVPDAPCVSMKHERFVSERNTRRADTRRGRYVAPWKTRTLPRTGDRALIDRDNASEVLKDNREELKEVESRDPSKRTKIKAFPVLFESARKTGRTTRSLEYDARRNVSDYYAQRRAVMERFHARQREISARYANRTSGISRSSRNDTSRNYLTNGNTTFPGHEPLHKNSTTTRDVIFHHPSITIDPVYVNESENNGISTKLDSRQEVVRETTDHGSNANLSRSWSNSNIAGNAVNLFTAPTTPCANASGTFQPKTRVKNVKNDTREPDRVNGNSNRASTIGTTSDGNAGSDHQIWGECEGKVIYQHNLLLGLKGPSYLDTLFEVIIQGPVCITCVEALKYNETRATVMLHSGGRGFENAKLRLIGFRNEGFSYIIKVWGVGKVGPACDNVV